MTNPNKVVAVTGLHRGDNPQPGSAVIRSLRRQYPELRVVGLSYDPLESGLYSCNNDRLDSAYSLPFPGGGAAALKERLSDIISREPIDFIIPTLDSEIANFIKISPYLRKSGIQIILPSQESLDRRSKHKLSAFCETHHIPCPETRTAFDIETLVQASIEIGYPLFIKGRFYGGELVHGHAELAAAARELFDMWGGPVMAQQALVGEEYCYTGIGDGKNGVIGYCAIRKLLVTKAGKGFAGVVINDRDLDQLVQRIVVNLDWYGPFEMEFIKPMNGRHMLIEINPRFPAWIDFPSQIGTNLPAILFDRTFGLRFEKPSACPPGKMFLRHSIDLVGDIADLAQMVTLGTQPQHHQISEVETMK